MQDTLKALAELQKVDLEIAALKKAGEIHPKQMAELERELGAARATLEAERNRILDIEKQKRTLEQNIADEKDKVKKWEARLSEQRSTREYAALAREIDIAKKANQTMAEELIELGKQYASGREALKGKEVEFAGKQSEITAKLTGLQQKAKDSNAQVKQLESKRGAASNGIDAKLLQRYESVRKKRMPALVAVRAARCSGCNMQVPPQLYNTLCATLATDVCPSCNRIIYAAEALEPRVPAK